ncbi:hypothetical protein L3Y34_019415 [Caenorhabditis briggsae]|uniref:Uncharacterized protein n=1 Tax=Caenorhabditis briggsae TaxID=6238 RepID=A0AAE9IVX6_CAEBR|nr:hypothetical protein L3Y34_019415 [Caenorhabditis briggsae]
MSEEVFKHSSLWYGQDGFDLDTNTTKGLKCVWKKEQIEGKFYLTWQFSWEDLNLQRLLGLTGEIIWRWNVNAKSSKIEVDVTDEVQTVLTEITEDVFFNCNVRYEYTLVPIISMTELYDEMFLPSDKNDAILEVDGMQLHVNKSVSLKA